MDRLEIALQVLERPPDFGWFGDEDMFETWGLTMSNAINSDDLINESNFDVACMRLEQNFGTAQEQYGPNIEIIGIKHWAVGSLDQIAVRVVKEDSDYCHHIDDRDFKDVDLITEKDLTQEFLEIVDMMEDIEVYPLLDEDHHSELEHYRTVEYIDMEFCNYSDGTLGWAEEVAGFCYDVGLNPWDDHIDIPMVIEALLWAEMADLDNEDVIEFIDENSGVMERIKERKWLDAGQQVLTA